MKTLLRMENICKSFVNNNVLYNVDFEVKPGEVHAILGENGAGKSTLIKILGGIYKADSGNIFINDKEMNFRDPSEARENGVSVIHQELMLTPNLSIAENIFLGREIVKNGMVCLQTQEEKAQKLLDTFEMKVSSGVLLKNLTVAQQQMIEIIRAVSFNAKIIAMDEPTSSLSDREADILFNLIDGLKKNGLSIIYVSHKLSDLFRVSDKITVLRDGRRIETLNTTDTTSKYLVNLMVGRDLGEYYHRHKTEPGDVVLHVEDLSDGGKLKNGSFSVRSGEILGISGLVGAGRSELLNCVFGMTSCKNGEIWLDGREVLFKTPKQAISAGIGLVCEDRKLKGLFLKQNVSFNITITILHLIINTFKKKKGVEEDITNKYINEMNIKVSRPGQLVGSLSGGNQQKVLISRWLTSTKKILLLDEPTKGVDIKSKEEIYRLIDRLAMEGMAIVFVSSELPELINISDRIMVMSNGITTGVVEKKDFSQQQIMMLATKEFRNKNI